MGRFYSRTELTCLAASFAQAPAPSYCRMRWRSRVDTSLKRPNRFGYQRRWLCGILEALGFRDASKQDSTGTALTQCPTLELTCHIRICFPSNNCVARKKHTNSKSFKRRPPHNPSHQSSATAVPSTACGSNCDYQCWDFLLGLRRPVLLLVFQLSRRSCVFLSATCAVENPVLLPAPAGHKRSRRIHEASQLFRTEWSAE